MEKKKLYNKLRDILNAGLAAQKVKYAIRHDALIEKALYSTEPGVSNQLYCDHEIIVSLTTYGRRLYDVVPTIECIMQGSMKPNKIVLWLGYELENTKLPIAIQNQQKRGLEVEYCKDIRSYTKLVPALRKYPDAAIITVDDDALYHYDVVERLVNEHILYPQDIISNRVWRVSLDKNKRPLGYMKWKAAKYPTDDSYLNFLTGVGGVLYPPHSLPEEAKNEDVFLDICKHADDVWFYAMSLLAGTHTRKCQTHNAIGDDFLTNEEVQDTALLNFNTKRGRCENDVQLEAVFDRYNLWDRYK